MYYSLKKINRRKKPAWRQGANTQCLAESNMVYFTLCGCIIGVKPAPKKSSYTLLMFSLARLFLLPGKHFCLQRYGISIRSENRRETTASL